ncbi:MAG: DUF2851 family protein [Nitrospinae bacterium]|nr:DUF2851 family protein [Nitrospinota bacterium]
MATLASRHIFPRKNSLNEAAPSFLHSWRQNPKHVPFCAPPACEVREENAPYLSGPDRISEKLLKCIWFDKEFFQPLKTLDGKSVTILSPGWWNRGAGPDFLNAVFRDADGKVQRGNVEVHVNKNDWDRHSHGGDKNYEPLALHVFFNNDGGKGRTRSKALQIELAPFLRKNIAELKDEMDPDDYPLRSESVLGRCCPALQKLDPEVIAGLLDSAGEDRMREKAACRLKSSGPGGFEQVCYEGMMEALGYKNNGPVFLELARRVPCETVISVVEGLNKKEAAMELQSLFLSAAGFFPIALDEEKGVGTGEAEEYARMAMNTRSATIGQEIFRNHAPEKFLFAGCRPANYPQVRLAGAAYLLERFREGGPLKFFMYLISGMDAREVCSRKAAGKLALHLAVDEPSDFWSSHHSWAGRKSPRPRKLIGRDRALVILWNAILPTLSAYSQKAGDANLEARVGAIYSNFPLLPENSVQGFMNTWLLGERSRRSPAANSAMRQQGLIHVYKKFCAANEKGCMDCGFLSSLHKGTRITKKKLSKK